VRFEKWTVRRILKLETNVSLEFLIKRTTPLQERSLQTGGIGSPASKTAMIVQLTHSPFRQNRAAESAIFSRSLNSPQGRSDQLDLKIIGMQNRFLGSASATCKRNIRNIIIILTIIESTSILFYLFTYSFWVLWIAHYTIPAISVRRRGRSMTR